MKRINQPKRIVVHAEVIKRLTLIKGNGTTDANGLPSVPRERCVGGSDGGCNSRQGC
jgi:hypothetical protein